MHALVEEISALEIAALREKFGADLPPNASARPVAATRSGFGDLQISTAMQPAKALKNQPREIAQVLSDAVSKHPAIAKHEIAGPGFVNLWLAEKWLAESAEKMATSARLGLAESATRGTVVLDYSSPNV